MTLNNVYNVIFTKIKKRDDLNLELTNITYIKNKRTILDNINLNFKGYCNGILGPNGSGKSTLLKIATGIIKPTSGTVKVGFRDLTSITRGDLSKLITLDLDTIGIRIPKTDFISKVVTSLNKPIVTTSVNKHGEESIDSIEEIMSKYNSIDTFIDKENIPSKASTIIDFTQDPYKVIRKGYGDYRV